MQFTLLQHMQRSKIIIGSDDDSLYALNETNGDLCWDYDLNNKVKSSPCIDEYNNNVYIGSDEGNLTCLDLRDGTFKWSHATGARFNQLQQ